MEWCLYGQYPLRAPSVLRVYWPPHCSEDLLAPHCKLGRGTQVGLFEAAARASPGDADVHVALGVLHNLGRTYEPAVAAFRCAEFPSRVTKQFG